jgi:hypothetical protein
LFELVEVKKTAAVNKITPTRIIQNNVVDVDVDDDDDGDDDDVV